MTDNVGEIATVSEDMVQRLANHALLMFLVKQRHYELLSDNEVFQLGKLIGQNSLVMSAEYTAQVTNIYISDFPILGCKRELHE